MKSFSWAIIGPGAIAHTFATGLKQLPEAKLHAVGSTSLERAEKFAEKFTIPKVYGSYSELLEDDDIDVVYISTVNMKHRDCVMASLVAGKAVLCEKPIGMNVHETEEMFSYAEKKGLFLMEALWTRFLPAYRRAMKWVQTSVIGEVKRVTAEFGFSGTPDPQSRLFNPGLGGGAVLDLGVYVLGVPFDIFKTDPIKISSSVHMGSTGVDETVSATLDFDEGRFADIFCSIRCEVPHSAYIMGSEGYIHIPDFWKASSAYLYKNGELIKSLENSKVGNGYQYEAQAVMENLGTGALSNDIMPPEESIRLAKAMEITRKEGSHKINW